MNSLLKLEDVLNYLNKVRFINTGGCAISALAMYRWLKKNSGIDNVQFVYLYKKNDYESKELYRTNQSILSSKSNYKPVSCCHAVIKIGRKYYDSTGLIEIGREFKKHIINNEQFIIDSINNIGVWNYFFSRKESIPEIEKKLKISLSDIII